MLKRLVHPAHRVPGIAERALGGLRARVTVPDQRFTGQVGLGDLLLTGKPVSGGQYRYPRLVYSGVTRRPASSMGSRT